MTEQRLIDANAFKENMFKYAAPEMVWDMADIVHKIDEMPIIEERKKGKWIEVHGYCTPGGDPVWACSKCRKGIHVYGIEHGTYGADIADDQWKACPNCGALMGGTP